MDRNVTKLQFPPEFFKREERSGHMVGELIKRTWAAELEMLAHVDEICQKYGLTYYAYWGTLLGAVRHNGFIPWDDDMDIAMKREDYNKFLEVAPAELPEEYYILNNYGEEWDSAFTKIANSRRIDFGMEYMKRFHNCPFAVGIDIFPLDYIPRDAKEAEEQKNILEYIGNITAVVLGRKEEADAGAAKEVLEEYDRIIAENLVSLEHICGVHFDNKRTILQQLYILFDQVSGLFTKEESDELTSNFNYIKRDYRVNVDMLRTAIRVPFETYMIPIPNGYDAILRKTYKDYMIPRKFASTHGDIYFRDQILVLADILDENCRKEINAQIEAEVLRDAEEKVVRDGKRRKVILMCNNTVEVLARDASVVRKLRYAIRCFEEKPEVMVWWRASRVDSVQMNELMKMAPQMVTEYRELVKEFQEKQLGVFDKGISVEKALEWCDAYYGDDNEIAKEFQRAGKPVMIADYGICGVETK